LNLNGARNYNLIAKTLANSHSELAISGNLYWV